LSVVWFDKLLKTKMKRTPLNRIGKKKQAKLKKRGIKAYSTFTKKNTKGLKRIPLKQVSKKKITKLESELEIRIELCKRAGGEWHKDSSIVGGHCEFGVCECGCGRPPNDWQSGYRLEPHELIHRGVGGKLSMDNTIMVRRDCHNILQHPKIR